MVICNTAPTCREALDEATALYPTRRRTSDGTCASADHHNQNPGSDHEPRILVDGKYYESAFDLSHDPSSGCDAFSLAELLRNKRDPRIKYVIANHQMFSSYSGHDNQSGKAFKAWEWRPYYGTNPHTSHIHVSVLPDHLFDVAPWWTHLIQDEDDMTDGTRKRLIREWYNRFLGRQPTVEEQKIWGGYWYTHGDDGEDLTMAGIMDSTEAKNYRKAHPAHSG